MTILALVAVACGSSAEPTDTVPPAPTSTPRPSATPAPGELTAEERAYFATVAGIVDGYGAAWESLGVLFEDVDIYDLEWLEDVGRMLGVIEGLNEDVWAIRGPRSCSGIHRHLLNAADYQKQFVELLSQAIIDADASGVRDAMAKGHSSTMELDKMMGAIDEFRQERGVSVEK